jgi:hypothetical protein
MMASLPNSQRNPARFKSLSTRAISAFSRVVDGGAIVDPILPDDPKEAEKLKWRFDF